MTTDSGCCTVERKSIYVDVLPEDLICSICSDVFEKPTQCSNGHVFCRACIDQWAEKWRSDNEDDDGERPDASEAPCPTCRTAIGNTSPVLVLEGVLNSFNVYCKYASSTSTSEVQVTGTKRREREFCTWTGKKKDLEHHLRTGCEFCRMTCPDCKETKVTRKGITKFYHDCISWEDVKCAVLLDFKPSIIKLILRTNSMSRDVKTSLDFIVLIEDLLAELLMRLLVQRVPMVDAAKRVLGDSLAKHAIAECDKALSKFTTSSHDLPETIISAADAGRSDDDANRTYARAGLTFPVHMIATLALSYLEIGELRVNEAIRLVAIVEYVMTEILIAVAVVGVGVNKLRPRHLMLAIKGDKDLTDVFRGVFSFCGMVPDDADQDYPCPEEEEEDEKEKNMMFVCQHKQLLRGLSIEAHISIVAKQKALDSAFLRLCAKAGIVKVKTAVFDRLNKVSEVFCKDLLLHYREGDKVPQLEVRVMPPTQPKFIGHTSSVYGEGLMIRTFKCASCDCSSCRGLCFAISHYRKNIFSFAEANAAEEEDYAKKQFCVYDRFDDNFLCSEEEKKEKESEDEESDDEESKDDDDDDDDDDSNGDDDHETKYNKSLETIEKEQKRWKPVISRRAFEACLSKISKCNDVSLSGPRCQIVYAVWEAMMVELLRVSRHLMQHHASKEVLESVDVSAAAYTRFGITL